MMLRFLTICPDINDNIRGFRKYVLIAHLGCPHRIWVAKLSRLKDKALINRQGLTRAHQEREAYQTNLAKPLKHLRRLLFHNEPKAAARYGLSHSKAHNLYRPTPRHKA